MQKLRRFLKLIMMVALVAGVLAATGFFTRGRWLPLFMSPQREEAKDASAHEDESVTPTAQVLLSDQAVANLGLKAKAVRLQSYWKTIQVPGMVVDRPGLSDRNIVSPITGVIAQIKHLPGDTVRPGDVLFTIRLLSESLHQTQSDLLKAVQDIQLAQANRERLSAAGEAIPGARLIELDNQIARLQVAVNAYQQELLNRGFTQKQIDRAREGIFVSEIAVHVPERPAGARLPLTEQAGSEPSDSANLTFEVQELKVELGQQVQAGQTLCLLANHQLLAVEGRAFRDETPLLERSVKEGWPVEVDFREDATGGWPRVDQTLFIRYLANNIDPVNRTFAFLVPLENESKVVQVNGRTQTLWRFRPGQKVRLRVRIEKMNNVFVLPAEAVARDSGEAFVFTQNVNTFERKPVRVIAQDRQHAVMANDGSLLPGQFVVQNGAAQLDRMTRSQSNSVPKGYHIHADGSLHKNEDEGK